MFRNFILVVIVGVGLLTLGSAARAQLIVGDGFNDGTGDITNDGGGVGWPSDNDHNWFTEGGPPADQVTAGGLSFTGVGATLAASGSKLTTQGGGTGAYRNLPGLYGGDANQTVWVSFLASNGSSANQGGYAGLSLINAYTNGGTYTQAENFFVGQINAVGEYGFVNYAANNSNGAPFLTGTGTDTTTHFLVTRFDFTASGSTEVSLYVDPTPGVAPTGSPQAMEDYTSSFVFDQVRFQSGSTADAAYNFDELRMGDTYADVAPVAAPEPSGVFVLGVGGLLLVGAARRRRRQDERL